MSMSHFAIAPLMRIKPTPGAASSESSENCFKGFSNPLRSRSESGLPSFVVSRRSSRDRRGFAVLASRPGLVFRGRDAKDVIQAQHLEDFGNGGLRSGEGDIPVVLHQVQNDGDVTLAGP